MEIETYPIQVVLQQETKSCSLATLTFLELLKTLRECFYGNEFDEKTIQYIDDEGDKVVFSTTEELELAFRLTPSLHIVLQKKSIPVPVPERWVPKDKRSKKRRHENGHNADTLLLNIEELEIDDERQRNKKFRGIGQTAHITIPLDEPWPAQFSRIFIDGNNLMFLTNGIRKITLQKRFRDTERVISSIAEAFADRVKITAIVMFDDTPTMSTKNYLNGSVVTVTSARPQFSTTDKALISWGKSFPNEVGNTIVVTSDRALSGELKTAGLSICKPSSWLKFVVGLLSTDKNVDYREWIDAKIGILFK